MTGEPTTVHLVLEDGEPVAAFEDRAAAERYASGLQGARQVQTLALHDPNRPAE